MQQRDELERKLKAKRERDGISPFGTPWHLTYNKYRPLDFRPCRLLKPLLRCRVRRLLNHKPFRGMDTSSLGSTWVRHMNDLATTTLPRNPNHKRINYVQIPLSSFHDEENSLFINVPLTSGPSGSHSSSGLPTPVEDVDRPINEPHRPSKTFLPAATDLPLKRKRSTEQQQRAPWPKWPPITKGPKSTPRSKTSSPGAIKSP